MEASETSEPRAAHSPEIDIVVVSFNSRESLRACVGPLSGRNEFHVIIVDNASTDGSLQTVGDLPVTTLATRSNRGFASGCNIGWRAGTSPYVLFLNPDAQIAVESVRRLASVLDLDPRIGLVAPRILDSSGALDFSLRRFPRLRSTYARALFLHRLLPRARWTDEVIRDVHAYEPPGPVEWVSGACMLVRREALTHLNGFDETFFMYCEDEDLCRRLWDAGAEVWYEPTAVCVHHGGASAPRAALLPTLAASRLRYARTHSSRSAAALNRAAIGLEALLRVVATRRGLSARLGHARALAVAALPAWPARERVRRR